MPAKSIDAFLELTPARKMRAKPVGEATDSAHGTRASQAVPIEITSFRFGNAKALAKAKEQRERDKLDDAKKDEKDAADDDADNVRNARQLPAKPTGNKEEDYRFEITKDIEAASPLLMQAFFSNSFKEKRQENNSFSEAKVTIRRTGGGSTANKPYLVFTFGGVYIVAYEFETADDESPEETIAFCFQTCEMKYTAQKATGDLEAQANIRGWNFVSQKQM
jgi:type VI protein secretion system component Hcp